MLPPLSSRPQNGLQKLLGSLRDVDGILGSFFVSSEGDIVEADFPQTFAEVASSVGQRVVRLRDALSLGGGEVSTLTVRYPNHKLSLRSVRGGVLAVVALASVNDAALRTAMNLVGQRCHDLASQVVVTPAPEPVLPVARPVTNTLVSSVPLEVPPPPTSDRPSSPEDRPSWNDRSSMPPEAGLPSSSRKPRAVYFRGKRIG